MTVRPDRYRDTMSSVYPDPLVTEVVHPQGGARDLFSPGPGPLDVW